MNPSETTKLYNRLLRIEASIEKVNVHLDKLKGIRAANADSFAEVNTKLKDRKKDITALNKTVDKLVAQRDKAKAKVEKKKHRKIRNRITRALHEFKR